MRTPPLPPEAALIDAAQKAAVPKLSVRRASTLAGISEGRWRQIAAGYASVGRGQKVPVFAPADTLARMARVVGVTAAQLREVGREDAATDLEAMSANDASPAKRERIEKFVRENVPPNRQEAALAMLRALIDDDRPTTGDRKIG